MKHQKIKMLLRKEQREIYLHIGLAVSLFSLLGRKRCRSARGLRINVRHHDTQDPAVYAKEEHTGYPKPRHKSRLAEELELVSLLQPQSLHGCHLLAIETRLREGRLFLPGREPRGQEQNSQAWVDEAMTNWEGRMARIPYTTRSTISHRIRGGPRRTGGMAKQLT